MTLTVFSKWNNAGTQTQDYCEVNLGNWIKPDTKKAELTAFNVDNS